MGEAVRAWIIAPGKPCPPDAEWSDEVYLFQKEWLRTEVRAIEKWEAARRFRLRDVDEGISNLERTIVRPWVIRCFEIFIIHGPRLPGITGHYAFMDRIFDESADDEERFARANHEVVTAQARRRPIQEGWDPAIRLDRNSVLPRSTIPLAPAWLASRIITH